MDRFEGPDPMKVAEGLQDALAWRDGNEALSAVVAQICETLVDLAGAVKALGEGAGSATEAISDLARRVSDLEAEEEPEPPSESALEGILAGVERARLGRLQWHNLAIDRGQFDVYLEGGEPPMIVTEFGRTPASPEELRRLGIQVEETS